MSVFVAFTRVSQQNNALLFKMEDILSFKSIEHAEALILVSSRRFCVLSQLQIYLLFSIICEKNMGFLLQG